MHRKLAALVVASLVALAIPPANSAGDAVGRANLDGTGANYRFISGIHFPFGIAVDAKHVYWANHYTGAIGRANLDGTEVDQRFITGADDPFDVAVDARHVYWADYSEGTIGRAKLDGTGANYHFITGAEQPDSVAVDSSHVYWVNYAGATIGRATLDGTGADQSFVTTKVGAGGVAVDARHIYWANSYPGTIGRANLDGTGADQRFITGAGWPQDVEVDSDHVYWANEGRYYLGGPRPGKDTGTIGRANLDGSSANRNFIRGAREAVGVAVDANHAYWTNSPFPKTTVSVSVQGTALVVAAGPRARDNLQVTRPSPFTLRVTDFPSGPYTGSVVHAGAGCTQNGDYTANCPASGITPVLPVLVTSGDRGDKVVNSSRLPSSLYGEGGNDLLIGGTAGDILKGGPGVDVMRGLDGNDLIRANDGASDRSIDCGPGSDLADLDLLPRDSEVKDCERRTRHTAAATSKTRSFTGAVREGGTVQFNAVVKAGTKNVEVTSLLAAPRGSFQVERVPITCDQGIYTASSGWYVNQPVKQNRFAVGPTSGRVRSLFKGEFTDQGRKAAGTFRASGDYDTSHTNCDTGTLHWKAMVSELAQAKGEIRESPTRQSNRIGREAQRPQP